MVNQQEAVIAVEGLTKTYQVGFWRKKVQVLKGVDLTVFRNETFGLLGPNGAGKTTTIKAMVGLLRPDQGSVRIFGKLPLNAANRSRLGFLPEHPSVYAYLTGVEFLQLCGAFFKLAPKILKKRIPDLLDKVGLSEDAARKQVRTYSKGMMQRLGFAQALINDPELLLLDEPMSGLDPVGRHDVRQLIMSLKKEGKTILFNSHILSDIEAICDRVGILVGGRIIETGHIDDLLTPLDNVFQLMLKGLDSVGQNNVKRLCLRFSEAGKGRYEATFNSLDAALKGLTIARQSGANLVELRTHRRSLEDLFMQLIEEYRKNETSARFEG